MNRINLTKAFVFCIALGVIASTHAVTLTPVKVAPNIYAFIGEMGARRTLMPHPAETRKPGVKSCIATF